MGVPAQLHRDAGPRRPGQVRGHDERGAAEEGERGDQHPAVPDRDQFRHPRQGLLLQERHGVGTIRLPASSARGGTGERPVAPPDRARSGPPRPAAAAATRRRTRARCAGRRRTTSAPEGVRGRSRRLRPGSPPGRRWPTRAGRCHPSAAGERPGHLNRMNPRRSGRQGAVSAAANSSHSSGTPLSRWLPRGVKRKPEPATRSRTVREQRISPSPAQAEHARGDVDGDAADVVADQLDLAGVQPDPDRQPLLRAARPAWPPRRGWPAPDRRRWPGSRRRSSRPPARGTAPGSTGRRCRAPPAGGASGGRPVRWRARWNRRCR